MKMILLQEQLTILAKKKKDRTSIITKLMKINKKE
jgi:hypothetical protein